MKLAVRNIRKSFPRGDRRLLVLDGVEFAARERELLAIVGPSGCGKSTLFEIICGLEEADSGSIEIDGAPCKAPGGAVGYMPQADLLFPWRRLIDNVILPLEVKGVSRRVARERVRPLLALFGLEGFESAYPSQLSGGMRQRAALLRTFAAEREIVALDEPFGALDAHTRRGMQEWLAGVRKELGNTILLVTHDVDEALILADRVVVLSARPARVLAEVAVDLPAPRSAVSPEFVALKAKILALLEAKPAAYVDGRSAL